MSGTNSGFGSSPKQEQSGAPFAAGSAAQGLTVDPTTKKIVLGDAVNGSTAPITNDRFIKTNNHSITLQNGGFDGTLKMEAFGLTLEVPNGFGNDQVQITPHQVGTYDNTSTHRSNLSGAQGLELSDGSLSAFVGSNGNGGVEIQGSGGAFFTINGIVNEMLFFASRYNFNGVQAFADNAAALAGGLVAGDIYNTAGVLKIVV